MPNYLNIIGQAFNSEDEPCFLTTGTKMVYNRVGRTWHDFNSFQDRYDSLGHPNGTWAPNEFGVPSPEWASTHMVGYTWAEGFGPGIEPNPPIPGIDPLPAEETLGAVLRWRGYYDPSQVYQPGALVQDKGWLMTAVRETSAPAAPVPIGEANWDLGDTPGFATEQFTGVVISAVRYDFLVSGEIQSFQIWVPTLNEDTNYTVKTVQGFADDESTWSYTQVAVPTLTAGQWTTVAVGSSIVLPGYFITVAIDALNSGASTPRSGGWTRSPNSNSAGPSAQGWLTQNSLQRVAIDKTDLDNVNRETELLGMVAGTTITFAQTNEPERNMTWRVEQDPVDAGTYVNFPSVLYQGAGALGEPLVGEVCDMNASIPVPSSTEYVQLADGSANPSWANTTGFLRFDGVDQPDVEGDAFGVRLRFQQASKSEDWEWVQGTGNIS